MSLASQGAWLLVAGGLAIAVGGGLTTKGWDLINANSARRALIDAAIQELRQNRDYLSDLQNAADHIENPLSIRQFTEYHFEAVQQLRTSRFYSTLDSGVPLAVSNYLKAAGPANGAIRFANERTARRISAEQKKENIVIIANSPAMTTFREVHETLDDLLKKQK